MNGYRKSHKILKVGPDAFLEHCKQNLTFAGLQLQFRISCLNHQLIESILGHLSCDSFPFAARLIRSTTVANFCAQSSDSISQGNQWWSLEISAVDETNR